MQFFLTLRDKKKQNRRKRNLRVPSAATKQIFSDDDYEEQNAGMYSDLFCLTYFIAVISNSFLLFVISKGTLGRIGNAFTSVRTRVANGTMNVIASTSTQRAIRRNIEFA
ncbi:conserved hypothetical protein [Trichinella spiralis]|uniref:hypothetical protein n=1 Tax=Trichinella spiralis TaxID=6334 RepID=UPI0001EFC5F6|nr:conserved hypothetical protein [Trichinella spiralis]